MNRRSLIKRIIDKLFRRKSSKQLLADLSFVTPDFLKKMTDKYGNENWALTADHFQNELNKAQLSYFDDIIEKKNPDEPCQNT